MAADVAEAEHVVRDWDVVPDVVPDVVLDVDVEPGVESAVNKGKKVAVVTEGGEQKEMKHQRLDPQQLTVHLLEEDVCSLHLNYEFRTISMEIVYFISTSFYFVIICRAFIIPNLHSMTLIAQQ
jgi:hypothetical protein